MSGPSDDQQGPGPDLRKHDSAPAGPPEPIDPWAAPPVTSPAPEPARPAIPGAAPASIWTTLDGSTPVREPTPTQFTKPAARPLDFPGLGGQQREAAPAPAYTPGAPGQTADGRSVLVLASWGSRLGAFLLDNIIVGLLVFAITTPIAVAMGMTFEQAVSFLSSVELPDGISNGTPYYVLFVVQTLAQPTLLAIILTATNGQTPGKRLVGLRVVSESGLPMTFAVAVRREVLAKTFLVVLAFVLTFGIAFVVNYLWPLWDAQNRAGQDFLAKTRVVVDKPAGRG